MLWKGFQRPKRLEVERETLTDRFGRFHAQPFERGFGTTIGNAIRRVLLSSIEGAAITAVKIDGVLHEFSPIPGVVEDATDIILNLKQIPLKLHVDQTKTLTIRVDKAGVVHAPVGKISFAAEALVANAHALMDSIVKAKPAAAKGRYLKSVTMSSTMGPGVAIDTSHVDELTKH